MTPRLESLSILEPYQDYQAEETDGTPVCLNSLRRMIIQSMGRHPNWFADDLITNHLVAPNLTMLHVKLPTPPSFPHLASPPNPILSFIRNSKMNLEILHFEPPIIRNRPQDESHLLRLLKLLHHLRVFIAPHVFFPRSLLNQMKQGHILPNVQQLEIRVASTRLFADMVERRVKESLEKEGFVRLKRACGFYPEFYRKSKVKDVRNERRKMDRLNEVYGTDLKLKAVGRRGDPFAIRDD
ncbi:hypothetical protein H0H93_009595 [Arthromyces matolae]|nr:hypothetical protein H0H93_009595 [Arthromyces matolae]